MIVLTDLEGGKLHVAADHISIVREVVTGETGRAAIVLMSGQTFYVKETVSVIVAKCNGEGDRKG